MQQEKKFADKISAFMTRLEDEYFGCSLKIDAPPHLVQGEFNVLHISGSFAEDKWHGKLGLNPCCEANARIGATSSLAFRNLPGPSGKGTYNNEQIIELVREARAGLSGACLKKYETKIAAFEHRALICGVPIEPACPQSGITPPLYHNPFG